MVPDAIMDARIEASCGGRGRDVLTDADGRNACRGTSDAGIDGSTMEGGSDKRGVEGLMMGGIAVDGGAGMKICGLVDLPAGGRCSAGSGLKEISGAGKLPTLTDPSLGSAALPRALGCPGRACGFVSRCTRSGKLTREDIP